MLISLVTPVLNGAATIERTLKSVSVQQGDFEHIVVDGGSTDETPEIVEGYQGKYPVRLVRKPDRSLYEGVWNGMQSTRGDMLAYLNADDVYLPWTFGTVRSVIKDRPEVQWLTGIPSWYFEKTGASMTNGFAPIYIRSLIQRGWYSSARLGFLQQESMFWKRSLWDKANPEELLMQNRLAGDFHLWRRFARFASLHTVAAVLASFTISDRQASRIGLERYLLECGVKGNSVIAPPAGRLAHRLLSFILSRRVILASPPSFL